MIFYLALFLAAAAPATTPSPLSKAEVEAVRTLHEVGQCLAARYPDDARKVLAIDFRSRTYGEALRELGRLGGLCAQDQLGRATLRSAGLPFAGSVAEALLERDGTIADLAARTGFRPELPGIEARNAGEFMAFCTLRKNAAGAADVLRSEPGSPQEIAAFAALGPTLTGCVPAKSKLEFSHQSLRALLALGAYRLAMHNALPAPRPGEAG